MIGSQARSRGPIDFGLDGPHPPDILVLMGALFATYSIDALAPGMTGIFKLSLDALESFTLWRVLTYPFVAGYGSALGLLISMWMILVFGKQVFYIVGRRAFWRSFFMTTGGAGVVALLFQALLDWTGLAPATHPGLIFSLMDGQLMVLTFLITGFAVFYGHTTVYLFFILPVRASWFIGLEIVFSFLGFLSSRDLSGFIGICAAVTLAYFLFSGVHPRRFLHEMRLRLHKKLIEARLRRQRRRGGGGGVVQGPWVN